MGADSVSASQTLHSPVWHRVEKLRLHLREDVAVERHVVREAIWYVIKDRFSTKVQRVTPAVYGVLMRMDGKRTLDQIWRETVEQFGEDAPGQDQILHTASQLYSAALLRSDGPVDQDDLAERDATDRKRLLLSQVRNPMFVRIPLCDPDRFLNATQHLVRPFCSWFGALVWCAAMVWLAVNMVANWPVLTSDIADRVLAAESLITIILVYPLIKILHELGHAYATKLAGQEVHEMGVMLLTLLPAPFVDASASAMVPQKWQRAFIAAAGMIVELAVAALAMLVWLKAQPGLARSIAFDTLLIASVSTLIFNGNPLLRFDAYYILCDVLELPNLGSRATRYVQYLAQKYLLGFRDAVNPVMARGERFWFLLYAPASFIYRMFTLFGIGLFISTHYFFVGIALVVWMMLSSLVWPVVQAFKFVLLSPSLNGVRLRAVAVTFVAVAILAGLFGGLPLPSGTVVRGLVWVPEEAYVVASVPGTFAQYLVQPGVRVAAGEELARLEDPFIPAKRRAAEARLVELEARLRASEPRAPYDTQVVRRQLELASDELAEMRRKEAALVIKSPGAGEFVLPGSKDMIGSWVKRGQLIGYVMPAIVPQVRALVPEAEIDLVRSDTRKISLLTEGGIWTGIENVQLARQFPKSTRRLPGLALASVNGGPFALDPAAKEKTTTIEPFFEIDLTADTPALRAQWGQRVWVRFDHGATPLAVRLYRSARQLFLGQFHV